MSEDESSYIQQQQSQSQSANLNHLAPERQHKAKQQRQSLKIQARNQQQNIQQILLPNPTVNRLTIVHQSKPRLIIDQIVLQNFKSYADTQVIGPFHQNFTSVVGPNGSGKSNLIESMLFIFGYKANWMRLKSLNQLIHNSSTMGNVEKASVEVRFKKIIQSQDGRISELPGEEFSLRRTVKQSGQSKYFINRNASTQADVKTKLKQQGIDLNNNRFLILQGEVEQISQMKQKSGDREKPGLLEYLQDIIGSNVYIDQIEASVTQYNSIEETKHEKGQLMKLAEVQLRNMSKGKEQAIKFVKKERQIYQIHNILQQVIISNGKYESKQFVERLHKAEMQRDKVMNQEREKLKKQAQRMRDIKKNRLEIENLEKQLAKEKEAMNKMHNADKNLRQQLQFKGEDLGKYKVKLNDLDKQLDNIIKESKEVKEVTLPTNKEKREKLKIQLQKMQQQLLQYDKPELKQKLKSLETQLKKVELEIKSFQDKHKSMQKIFEEKFKRNEKNQIKELELKRKLDDETQTLQKVTAAQSQATKIKQSFSKQLEQISNKRKDLVGQLQKISLSLRQEQNNKKQTGLYNDMFEKIMQQNIPGVIGRLGDLGSVPKQFDEIITSCCGRLDNIVVRNLEAAQAVLNFLKTAKLGRLTCIILDKIEDQRKFMEREWINLPNTTRLFDVIKPSMEEVRIAFYFAISDTLYCQNSQMGLQYSMKDDRNRRRVVSKRPGGYIIYELNGLMNGCLAKSGGFTVKAKSKARPQEANEIKELENQKAQLAKQITRLEEDFKKVKQQYEGVQKDLDDFKREKRNIESSISQTKQQLSDLAKNSTKNVKNMEQQKAKKQKQIQSILSHIESLQKSKRQITNQIAQLQKQQRLNQTQKVSRLRDNYKISKQEYQLLDKDIQKKIAFLETVIKRADENKKVKDDVSRKIDMLDRQIKKIQKQIEDIETKATQTFMKMKAIDERIEKCQKAEEELKVLFEQEEKEVRESRFKIEKVKQQVNICQQKLNAFRDTIAFAEQQLRKYRETYRQLSATYDFLQEIDSIEFMNIDDVKKNNEHYNKADQSSFLNQSIEISNASSKIFPLEKLLETSPFDDLSEDRLDPFLMFTEKMRTMLVAESQNLKKMSGSNLQIITQYRKKFSDFKKKHEEFQAVRLSQLELKKKIQELKEKRLQAFREGFGIINSKLKQVYQLLTRGGDAQLQLIDSLDPFSDGINFSVRPPKKAWKEINKLSGGEKTLSSLSLIFALHYYKPTPLYFMDEIDAALDFKNVSIVADYIKKRTKDAQFIIISLRNNMFELADKLVGVYKTYDKTKIINFVPTKTRTGHGLLQKQNLDSNRR